MNNGLIPERHLGRSGVRWGPVDAALRAERDPKGDMKAEAMISVLLATHRRSATYEVDPEL